MTQASAIETPRDETGEKPLSRVSRVKGSGYLSSIVSVFLLAVPGLKAALESPILFVCLAAGAASSIAGMYLRWRSHRLEQKEKAE